MDIRFKGIIHLQLFHKYFILQSIYLQKPHLEKCTFRKEGFKHQTPNNKHQTQNNSTIQQFSQPNR